VEPLLPPEELVLPELPLLDVVPLEPELPLLEVAPPELVLPEPAPLEVPEEVLAPELELFAPCIVPVPLPLEQAQAAETQVRPMAAMVNCARISLSLSTDGKPRQLADSFARIRCDGLPIGGDMP